METVKSNGIFLLLYLPKVGMGGPRSHGTVYACGPTALEYTN